MQNKRKILICALVIVFLLPRVALLLNGLDAQRIWDTNTPASFQFLSAVNEGDIVSFLASDHKYPLLGSYFFVPVIGAYFLFERAFGLTTSIDHFVDRIVLGESWLFFFIRFFMLVVGAVGIWLVYRLVTDVPGGDRRRSGVYALLLIALDLYLALFAVTPRIHSFAFTGAALALFTSFFLIRKRTAMSYGLAFGAAGAAFALSQSGITTLILPIIAHVYTRGRWRQLAWGIVSFLLVAFGVGYPEFIFSFATGESSNLLSAQHAPPVFSLGNFFPFAQEFFLRAELLPTFILMVGLYYWARKRVSFDAYDGLAWVHIGLFLIIFGATDVVTGRFALVIIPAMVFLSARIWSQLDRVRWFRLCACVLALIQALGIMQLTRIALAKDTRTETVAFILGHSGPDVAVATTLDHHLLGLVATPSAIRSGSAGDQGSADERIAERHLIGPKSRYVLEWDGRTGTLVPPGRPIGMVVVHGALAAGDQISYLEAQGYHMVQSTSGKVGDSALSPDFISWGSLPPSSFMPLALSLFSYRAMGENLSVLRQDFSEGK